MAENPFLLPPGSASPAKPEPTLVPPPVPPSEAATRDPDRYIAIPPSIESATHRIARPVTAPTAVHAPEHAPEPMAEPVAEETQLATPAPAPLAVARLAEVSRASAPPTWSLVLPDGSRVAVDGPILLGRDPAPPPEHPEARPVPLDDPGKTVSKTHALFEPGRAVHGGIRVQDLHSTNGVAISSGGVRTVLAPGGEGSAVQGSVIELGSFTVLVDAG